MKRNIRRFGMLNSIINPRNIYKKFDMIYSITNDLVVRRTNDLLSINGVSKYFVSKKKRTHIIIEIFKDFYFGIYES